MDAGHLLTSPCLEAIRTRDGRLLVTCHVTPRARSEWIACEGGKLRVWLHAPPVEGAANEALIKLLESQMQAAAEDLDFELAAVLRDQILELRADGDALRPSHAPLRGRTQSVR